MAGQHTDLPPPYTALTEENTTQKIDNEATEVTVPHSDDESEVYGALFEHKDNRIGFIQKVLVIKLFQIMLVAILLAVFGLEPDWIYVMMEYSRPGRFNLTVVSSSLALLVVVLIHLCDKARFTRPFNYIFLLAYPLSFGFFFGVMTWRFNTAEFFTSWILFLISVFIILVYSTFALQTKLEFKTGIAISIAGGVYIVTCALTVPFIYVDAFSVVYCSLSLFGLTIYMLYDIHIMMSKDYHFHLSPSDFVKAAVIMHVDYRYIFTTMINKTTCSDEEPALNNAA